MVPIEINREYITETESVSSDGNGVAHIGGMAVFIPYTAAGDKVKIKITDVKKRYAEGVVTEIITPSQARVNCDCPYYGRCGGCNLRHIDYKCQLEIKKDIVQSAMRRIGGFKDFTADEITGMDNPSRYRNKTIFHANGNECGFYPPKSHTVLPVSDCLIGMEENKPITRAVMENTRGAKQIFTRKSHSTDEIMVVITAEEADDGTLVKSLLDNCANISGIILNGRLIYGAGTITDSICGIEFKISPQSFFQVNPVQTEKLYAKALEYAAIDKTDNVLDIYCGIGTISLCAAQTARCVTGVEIVAEAVANARENAARNGITNAEFYASSADKIVPRLIDDKEAPDIVILDPPRKGSDEKTLAAIIKAEPKRVVYISCNPATLARDTRFLADNGYKISRSAVFDLFPHTSHVETIMLLQRQDT